MAIVVIRKGERKGRVQSGDWGAGRWFSSFSDGGYLIFYFYYTTSD